MHRRGQISFWLIDTTPNGPDSSRPAEGRALDDRSAVWAGGMYRLHLGPGGCSAGQQRDGIANEPMGGGGAWILCECCEYGSVDGRGAFG